MSRIISAAAAALAASPLLIADPGEAKPSSRPQLAENLTTQCKFYVNTLHTDSEQHFKGAPLTTPRGMAAAGAVAMLLRAHAAVSEDGNPANDDNSTVKRVAQDGSEIKDDPATPDIDESRTGSDLVEWSFEGRSVRVSPPADSFDTAADYCTYLQGVADEITAISPDLKAPELFQYAANGAIQASREDIDPHSGLVIGLAAKSFQQTTKGAFGGVGIELVKSKGQPVKVIKPIPQGPSEKAGLQKDDIVLKINGRETAYMTISQFVDVSRGEVGEPVTLTIKRGDEEPFEVELIRDQITPEVVKGTLLEGTGTASIKVEVFNEQTLPQFIKTVARLANEAHEHALKEDDIRKTLRVLLPDFSNNPGGLKGVAEVLNDLLIDNEEEGCLRITGAGKHKDEELVCADTHGRYIFEAVDEVAAVLFQTPEDPDGVYTYSALIYPEQVAKDMPRFVKIGVIDPMTKRVNLEISLLHGLDHANIFEVLKRLALSGATDKATGKIMVPREVPYHIEVRAKLEKERSDRIPKTPGLQIKTRLLEDGSRLPAFFIPAARQNPGSASASEITTGNLQDLGVTIVGESHGKGSVQVQIPVDAEGNYTRGRPNDPPAVALQKMTVGGFFPGKSGLSNHGSQGVPADILVRHGDFRDAVEQGMHREVDGLIPDDMKRHPRADQRVCTLKEEFRDALSDEQKKSVPSEFLSISIKPNAETREADRVEVVDTALVCALAEAAGATDTKFVTIAPKNAEDINPAP